MLEDKTPTSIYHKFDIQFEEKMADGEYQWLLIKNPNGVEIEINQNDIFKSTLVDGATVIESFGLLRIGDYLTDTKSYNKETVYKAYER